MLKKKKKKFDEKLPGGKKNLKRGTRSGSLNFTFLWLLVGKDKTCLRGKQGFPKVIYPGW